MSPFLQSFANDCGVPQLADMFAALDREGITNRHARSLLGAFEFIAAEPGRSLLEKVDAMEKLTKFRPGCEVLIPSLRKFLGWAVPQI